MEMTPRQRWLALLEGHRPDRLPTDYWATPELHARLKSALGCQNDEELCRRLHIDQTRRVGASPLREHHPDDPKADLWGIRRRKIDYGSGAYHKVDHNPLAAMETVDQIHAFRWPSPDDFDYTAVTRAVDEHDGYRLLQGCHYEPVLLFAAMRGMEQSYEDMLVNPEIADAVLGHIFDFYHEYNRRTLEAGRGRIELCILAEDLGAQTGPLFSLEVYKRFILPNQKRMAELYRSFGARIFYHSDGACRPFLPYLIDEVGINILNPIQWRCIGMERQDLVRDFGDRIVFHGSMDNQQTLPFGSIHDVVAELKENLRIFADCRWICAPCHNIQAVTPIENVIALYERAHELGGAEGV